MNDCSSKFFDQRMNRAGAEPHQHADRANQQKTQEIPMTRSTILAFAAIGALGAAALVSSGATASPNNGINNGHPSQNTQTPTPSFKGKPGPIGGNPITWTPNAKKPLIGGNPITWTQHKKIGGDPNTWTPSWVYHHHHHHHHDWRWWYARYHVVPVETSTTVVAPVVKAADGNCNCLTKEYLPDGSVLFKDLCTKEAAMATPDELKAQVQSQAPQVR
jgi:hypothetical protein